MLQAEYLQQIPFVTMDLADITFSATTPNASQDSDQSYCLCGQPYNPGVFMIQCDSCKDWFHSSCINFREWKAVEIDRYHCPRCSPFVGPSISKSVHNLHRHDYWDVQAANKPVQTGTATFIKELCTRHFAVPEDILVKVSGHELTKEYIEIVGFNNPILIEDKKGLDMMMPSEDFSYIDVLRLIGEDKEIDVIDVCRQANIRMTLGDFVQYVADEDRKRIFNVVSLEFSNTSMASIIEPPLIARKLDWVNSMWPENCPGKPQVQKYCLMSVKNSYTDFHIDFGGTSVWYHVLRGEKIFLFVEPTNANLTLYSQWLTSTNQSETFFGDQVDQCFKCHVKQGQTMLIPTGWIHAVYTPVDSLVFGGNFLHSYNISMQLNCYEIEKKTKTETKFMYPNFMMINFFAASKLLDEIVKINLHGTYRAPPNLLNGLRALQQAIKHWNGEKELTAIVREQLPFSVNIPKVIKDIGKEIRHAERIINHLHPPKPERESKRRRKRPVNKDFVDYSLSPKSFNFGYIPSHQSDPPSSKIYSKSTNGNIKLTVKSSKCVSEPTNAESPKTTIKYERPNSKKHNHKKKPRNISHRRPQETVAEYKGGTVLKFKLGTKDVPPVKLTTEEAHASNSMTRGVGSKDVYDFHDESDKDINQPNPTVIEVQKKAKSNVKVKITAAKTKKRKCHKTSSNKNGIESLLKASLTVPTGSQGDTSPSTSEAIAGMLSISQNWSGSKTKRPQPNIDEPVNDVHQDEDYIYPALDNSEDEEAHIFKPRGRTKIDEAWNPKARVGPLLPKMNRPAREGTKKQAIEKILEAAASRTVTKRTNEDGSQRSVTSSKRQYRRKKPKPKIEHSNSPIDTSNCSSPNKTCPSTSSSSSSTTTNGSEGTSNNSNTGSTSNTINNHHHSSNVPKPRKGMKTVKQRLGKILKIHKMIH